MAGSLLAIVASAQPVDAHPGGVNKEGCHKNRKTGEYHCHGSRRSRQILAAPARRSDGSVYYRNCDAVRVAGKAPLRRGDPGYRAGLDRDNDGLACEPYGDRYNR
ncbi:excalibur calcium-binding domain-containing protein [Paraurantiacibacter namhicola]|uniref:excalibur calcium-binding domain-containing protein n=1 Tax=Paraurantiacibacter namhicola TaxID=645517 RepID=UPI00196A014C|nr:excalibur calcium-binding domain-containing protein [Paraurantiacibacter namhicola]